MAIEGAALPKLAHDAVSETPFYIPATGPATRPRRTLKFGDTFVVVDSHGEIGASAGGTDGLFHADTRFISRLELLLNGTQPLLLGCNVRDDNTSLTVDLTNPDVYLDHHLVLPKDTIHIVRTVFLWRDTAYQRLAVRNHGDRPVELRLSILFDGDFADLFEVRGIERKRHGRIDRAFSADRAVLTYDGLDGKRRRCILSFDPPPNGLTANGATYLVPLAPKAARPIFFTIGCGFPEPPKPVPFRRGLLAAHRELRRASQNAAPVVTSNDIFNAVLCRSMADL